MMKGAGHLIARLVWTWTVGQAMIDRDQKHMAVAHGRLQVALGSSVDEEAETY
jgi:hypothetical protein